MTSSVRGPLPSALATAAYRAALALDAKTSNGAEELLSAAAAGGARGFKEEWRWLFFFFGEVSKEDPKCGFWNPEDDMILSTR